MSLIHIKTETVLEETKLKLFAITLLLMCIGFFIFRYSPADSGLYPPCLFQKITGLYCPGCGTARALHALLHGRISTAISYNASLVVLAPTFLHLYVRCCLRNIKRMAATCELPPSLYKALLIIVVIFGILRNIPAYPLCSLTAFLTRCWFCTR